MGENASQIEREIVAERAALGRNLEVLETKARDLADWRVHYRNHPGIFLGAAAGVGLALGALSRGRSEDFGYIDYAHPPERPEPRAPRKPLAAHFRGPKGRRLVETWEHVTDALLAMATAKAVDVIADYLPGFGDEYRRHAQSRSAFWQEQSAGTTASRSGVGSQPARATWETPRDEL
jgi:hypothetical protein